MNLRKPLEVAAVGDQEVVRIVPQSTLNMAASQCDNENRNIVDLKMFDFQNTNFDNEDEFLRPFDNDVEKLFAQNDGDGDGDGAEMLNF